MKTYYVYILASHRNGTLYTGITNDLMRRVYQHKNAIGSRFTAKYNVTMLVYYEMCTNVRSAITREKQIKYLLRRKKIELIERTNPEWKDLYEG